jgi:hypothetical protein
MRALSGAIITAAALIGLGLTAQGIGTRYQPFIVRKALEAPAEGEKTPTEGLPYDWDKARVEIKHLDSPMKLILTVLVLCVGIGLAICFIGLAYHHHRRHHEHLQRLQGTSPTNPRVTV